MKYSILVALVFSCFLFMSCDNEDEGSTTINSIDDAKPIVNSLDSLEKHIYLSMPLFTLVGSGEIRLLDTTFNGRAGGSAHVSGEIKISRFGGHCGGPDYRTGSLAADLIDYSEGAQLTGAGAFDYNCTGVYWSGICIDPRSYSRHDTLTFVSPHLNVVYVDDGRGINIKDDVEVKVVYIHEFYQLRPFSEPPVTVDSTVTRKYYVKTSSGQTFEWQWP